MTKQHGSGKAKKAEHLYEKKFKMGVDLIELVEYLFEHDGDIPPKSGEKGNRTVNDLVQVHGHSALTKKVRKDFDANYISRPVFSSLIWGYIKLEDLGDGRSIRLDARLKKVFSTSKSEITMFEIGKLFPKAVINYK